MSVNKLYNLYKAGKSLLKGKSKSKFIKDKSGTITGVKPGSFKNKKSWKDYVDTSHPSYKD